MQKGWSGKVKYAAIEAAATLTRTRLLGALGIAVLTEPRVAILLSERDSFTAG